MSPSCAPTCAYGRIIVLTANIIIRTVIVLTAGISSGAMVVVVIIGMVIATPGVVSLFKLDDIKLGRRADRRAQLGLRPRKRVAPAVDGPSPKKPIHRTAAASGFGRQRRLGDGVARRSQGRRRLLARQEGVKVLWDDRHQPHHSSGSGVCRQWSGYVWVSGGKPRFTGT